MAMRRGGFALTPPSMLLFIISVVCAVISILIYFRFIRIAIINPRYVYELLLVAYLVLVAGVIFRRV